MKRLIAVIIMGLLSLQAKAADQSGAEITGRTLLTVSGRIDGATDKTGETKPVRMDREMLRALPRKSLHTSTVVTDGLHHFEGFLVRDLLTLVGAQGAIIDAHALNDYVISIPVEDFYTYDVLIADSMDGTRLTSRDKGPLWIVYPRDQHAELQDIRYDYRWVWQLHRLVIR